MPLNYYKIRLGRAVSAGAAYLVSGLASTYKFKRAIANGSDLKVMATGLKSDFDALYKHSDQRTFFLSHVNLVVPLVKKDTEAGFILAETLNLVSMRMTHPMSRVDDRSVGQLGKQLMVAIPHVIGTHPEVALALAGMDVSSRSNGHPERYGLMLGHVPVIAARKPELALNMAYNIFPLIDTPEKVAEVAAHVLPLLQPVTAVNPERAMDVLAALYKHNMAKPVEGLKPLLVDAAAIMLTGYQPKTTAVHAEFTRVENEPSNRFCALLLEDNPHDARLAARSLDLLKMRPYEWPTESAYHMATTLVERQGIDVTVQRPFICKDFAVLASSNTDLPKLFVVFFSDDPSRIIAATEKDGSVISQHFNSFAECRLGYSEHSERKKWISAEKQEKALVTKQQLEGFVAQLPPRTELADFATAVQQHKAKVLTPAA